MASRITREGERNIRANDFLKENAADFARNAFVTEQITALDAEIGKVGDFYRAQISSDGNMRQNYEIAAEANDALKRSMNDIAEFAATMRDEIEGIEEKFRRPRSGGKRGRLARARAFIADAAPYKEKFIKRGLNEDFIEQLTAHTDALEQSLAAAVSKTAERIGSTESKLLALKKSSKLVSLLDPLVCYAYRDNPVRLSAWRFASHLERELQQPEKPKAAV